MAKKPSKPQPNGSPAAPMPAYFTSLSLENVRCFREKQTLDLSDGKGGPARWTILLGNNGTGKTTVLQALTLLPLMVRMHSRPAREGVPVPYFQPDIYSRLLRSPEVSSAINVLTRRCSLNNADRGPDDAWAIQMAQFWPSGIGIGIEPAIQPDHAAFFPLCAAYGASRRLGSAVIAEESVDDPVATLFSDTASLRHAEELLLQLDYSASKESPAQAQQKQHLRLITELLVLLLEEVEDIRFTFTAGTHPKPRVEFKTPYGWVPLRSLGYGYQTLIAWMVDLASRMAERYPDSADPLAEPAIVLVDEIDLHLHPKWQRELIGHLTKRFPNTQFIVTAHSPLVVQAAEGANLAVLRREGDQVVIDNNVDMIRNWRIDQIYTSELFGLPSARPPQLDDLMKQRQAILAKPKLTAADQRKLEELDTRIGPLPGGETAEDAETRRLIRESLELLKKGAAKP